MSGMSSWGKSEFLSRMEKSCELWIKLRKVLNSTAVLSTKEIVRKIDGRIYKDITKSLELIDALSEKVEGIN